MWGKRERVYTHRYTVTTRTTCIKMGSDESHFNVSLIVRDKITRPCLQTTTFEEKGKPKRYRTEVLPLTSLPLDQTGSQLYGRYHVRPWLTEFGSAAPGCFTLHRLTIIIIHSFYIALFSALEQTHCAHWHVILNE